MGCHCGEIGGVEDGLEGMTELQCDVCLHCVLACLRPFWRFVVDDKAWLLIGGGWKVKTTFTCIPLFPRAGHTGCPKGSSFRMLLHLDMSLESSRYTKTPYTLHAILVSLQQTPSRKLRLAAAYASVEDHGRTLSSSVLLLSRFLLIDCLVFTSRLSISGYLVSRVEKYVTRDWLAM